MPVTAAKPEQRVAGLRVTMIGHASLVIQTAACTSRLLPSCRPFRDGDHCCLARLVIAFMVENHPYRALADFRRKLVRCLVIQASPSQESKPPANPVQTRGVGVRKSAVLRSRFGERAAALLAETELSIADLAARCAFPVRRVENILRGSYIRLTLWDMSVIAGVLGTPLFNLLVPIDPTVAVVPLEVVKERGPRDT